MYNWDEKGFILGLAHAVKRIMTLHALKSGRIMGTSQDGSREFISLLAYICADGTKLPPALIYQGESGDLMDSWVADFTTEDEAYFAASANRWSCDNLGLQWLEKVFHKHTKDKARNRRRLLIVDGHSSHVNMRFITRADELRIILAIMLPHSTHRLQPLDVGLFQPLATEYSKQISDLMSRSFGIVSMTKRMFWSMFKAAWEASFTEKNITSAFAKTSIFPYNPSVVLDKIARLELLPELVNERTPMGCQSIQKMHRAYQRSPTVKRLNFILHANVRLAAQHSIDKHTLSGLVRALKEEKKKRSRGKRLNLMGEESNGPQFYSLCTIHRAKAYALEKEALEQANRDRIASKKVVAAANKVRKEQEKAERGLRAMERCRITAEKKLQHAVDIQACKELQQAAKATRTDRIPPKKVTKVVQKPRTITRIHTKPVIVALIEEEGSRAQITTSRGRTTIRTIQGSK